MRRFATAVVVSVLVSLLCASPAGGAEEEVDEGKRPLDGARLIHLARVVIVYPAGPGEDVARNLSSARSRARLLEKLYGMETEVAADDQVTAEQRSGHLVLLGWNNRLLGTETASRPFSRTAEGIDFLGIKHSGPDDDLMFLAWSPYDEEKVVFFWSRIDPERDRFVSFPLVGSNWAIYRDFLVLRQGMFGKGATWPPKRNEYAEAEHHGVLVDANSQRRSRRSDHYETIWVGGQIADADIDEVVQAREQAFSAANAALGGPSMKSRIRLYVYPDKEDKKTRTGVDDPVHSLPWKGELHMVLRMARDPASHEEIHLFAREHYGPACLTSLYEGLAVYHDGSYGGTDLDLLTAVAVEKNSLPTLDVLLDEASARTLPKNVLFPASGLLVGWLRTATDARTFTRVYGICGEGGVERLSEKLGMPAVSLEASFRQWAEARASARESDLAFLKEQAAARESYLMSDYAGLATALERALRHKPDDPQTLFNLASAQMRTGEYAKAEKNLRRTLALPEGTSGSRFVTFSHYQLGRLYDVQGRREDALAEYRTVLELPDEHDSHRLAREAIETPVTVDHLD